VSFSGAMGSKSYTSTLNTSALTRLISSGLWGDITDSDSDEEMVYSHDESFIDDEGVAHDGPGSDIGPMSLPLFRGDDEEVHDEVIEADSPAVPRQRNRQVPIIISSDEEDDGNYTDADTQGDHSRSWNEEEDEGVDYHDARSDSDDHGYHDYGTDGEPYGGGSDNDFYGYL
jgi:hypothetical protein